MGQISMEQRLPKNYNFMEVERERRDFDKGEGGHVKIKVMFVVSFDAF